MTQINLAVGIDVRGNPMKLYCGEDYSAAKAALDAAGQAGTVDIGVTSSKTPSRH